MKKILIITAFVLGLSMVSFAQGGGLFQRGEAGAETSAIYGNRLEAGDMLLPNHYMNGNQDANETPVGSGIAVLLGLGAAYAVAKKRREE